jgi:molecular chaperone GrpE
MPMTKKTEKEKPDTKTVDKSKKVKKTKDLENEIHQLKDELKQKNDSLLRCLADFDNYKKRVIKEQQALERDIKKHYLLELLDFKELLLQVLEDDNPKEGLRILLNQLEQFFELENIKYIECIDKPFNHQLHDAKATVEQADGEDNIIIDEIKKGYMVDDYVLRPSHVVVSKKKCEEVKS